MNTSRTTRLARFLLASDRMAVHFDPETKEYYRWHERLEILKRYAGQQDVFGSFTDLPKLGINPNPKYDVAPVGVYGYPIDFIISQFNPAMFEFNVFGSDADYIHVFRASNLDRVLNFRDGDNSLLQENKPIDEVEFPYEEELQELPEVRAMGHNKYWDIKERVLTLIGCDQAFVLRMAQRIANHNQSKWTGILRRLGIAGMIDWGTGSITSDIPTQVAFFDPGSLKVLTVIENKLKTRQYDTRGELIDPNQRDYRKGFWSQNLEEGIPAVMGKLIDSTDAEVDWIIDAYHLSWAPEGTIKSVENKLKRLLARLTWLGVHIKKLEKLDLKDKDKVLGRWGTDKKYLFKELQRLASLNYRPNKSFKNSQVSSLVYRIIDKTLEL